MSEENREFLSSLQLSIDRALLGEIIPSLRSIGVIWDEAKETVHLLFIHDGKISEAINNHYSSIVAEIDADYWGRTAFCKHLVIEEIYPRPINKKKWTMTAYQRKEPFEDPKE